MTEHDGPIWYDGAKRARVEALERIERDALAFLEKSVGDFERDDAAWLLLLDGLDIPVDLDEPMERTISYSYWISVTADEIAVSLSTFLPRKLEATFAALGKQPWCFAPRLQKGYIEMQVRGLDPANVARIEKRLSGQARAVRHLLRRGVATLLSIAAPSPLPRVTDALDDAVRRVEAIAYAKVGRLKRAGDRPSPSSG